MKEVWTMAGIMLVWAAIATLVSTTGLGATLELNKDRTIYITGTIDKSIMKKAAKLERLSSVSDSPIFLVVDSPGGHVSAGLHFLNAMDVARARGVTLLCFTPRMAASMAFHIVGRCDARYAFKYTSFMFHPIRIGGMFASFTADEMEYFIKIIRAWELPLNDELVDVLDIDKDEFYYFYSKETMFTSVYLNTVSSNFITIINNAVNVNEMFGEEK